MYKRCVVICGGAYTKSHIEKNISQSDDIYLVSVDSGADVLRELAIIPDIALGDFDSILPESKKWLSSNNVKTVTYPSDKDKTDLELTLEYLMENHITAASIYAALGGRIDHVLGNILLLTNPVFSSLNITIHDLGTTIFTIRPDLPLTISGVKDDLFSIIPLTPYLSGVTITGTKWELKDALINMGSSRTISNEFVSSSVSVSIKDGIAVGIHLSKDTA